MQGQDPSHTQRRPAAAPESWIDISARRPTLNSQPSSSSLSSRDNDTLNNTVHAQLDRPARRRRITISGTPLLLNLPRRPSSVDNSSQDEYDESESETEPILTSSNEDILHSTLASQLRRGSNINLPSEEDSAEEEQEDLTDSEDESSTTLGTASNLQCFTPQPNAFSHPPSSTRHSESTAIPGSYFPSTNSTRTATQSRQSHPSSSSQRPLHTPYTTNTHTPLDHDALLRDSLSTLLSCAAAARGLPKSSRPQPKLAATTSSSTHIDPSTLRLVPETTLLRPAAPYPSTTSTTHPASSSSSRSPSRRHSPDKAAGGTNGKGKRKARSRSASKERTEGKKPRRGGELETVTPTLLTWFVVGGVVVLVSALSFSAGYAVGRESGRLEGEVGGRRVGSGGLREGMRRLRWGVGVGGAGISAAA